MSPEFRNKPIQSDWTMPEGMVHRLDEVTHAVLTEHDVDGVPIPLSFQFIQKTGDIMRRLTDGTRADAELEMGNLLAAFDEVEERYPENPQWDRVRPYFVGRIIDAGHPDLAKELMLTINEPHTLIRTMMGHFAESEDWILDDVMQRITSFEPPRRNKIIQAIRNHYIDNDPSSPTIDAMNEALETFGAEDDHIQGWADSYSSVKQSYPWEAIVATVKADEYWADVPATVRQFSMLVFYEILESLPEQTPEEIASYYDSMDDKFPEAKIWSEFRSTAALTKIRTGDPVGGVDLSKTIRRPEYQYSIAADLIRDNYEDEAIEVAVSNRNPAYAAEILLDGEWRDEGQAALRKLEDIITSDSYQAELRIGCLEELKNRFLDQGMPEKAMEYQSRINDIREGQQ